MLRQLEEAISQLTPLSKDVVAALPPSKDVPQLTALPPSKDVVAALPPSKDVPQLTALPPSKDVVAALPPSKDVVAALPPSKDVPQLTALPPSKDVVAALPPSKDVPQLTALPPSKDVPQLEALPPSKDVVAALPPSKDVVAALPPSKDVPQLAVLSPSKDVPQLAALPPSKDVVAALPPSKDVVAALPPSKDVPQLAVLPPSKDVPQLTALPPSKDVPQELLLVIQNLFSSSACLNRSFLSDHCGLDRTIARKELSEEQKLLAHRHGLEISNLIICNIPLVSLFQNVVVYYLMKQLQLTTFMDPKDMFIALDMLKKLYKINEEMDEIIPYTSFYVPQIKLVLRHWNQHRLPSVNFINHPFVLENDEKMNSFILENMVQKYVRELVENAVMKQMQLQMVQQQNSFPNKPVALHPVIRNPKLLITIDRQNLITSTIVQLNKHRNEYKKPLVVAFIGEPVGGDGPSKDFFRLIFKDIFDPEFGMFKVLSKTQRIWFNPQSSKLLSVFRLVGILCGLAIYNQVIVDLPFPLALYKKLLKKKVNLSDLGDLDPTMAGSLKDILDYDDYDLQDVFGIYFEFSSEYLGQVRTVYLKKGGSNIPVTFDNKQEYVDLYIYYIFNASIAKQYGAFEEGFMDVCGGPMLQMFHPKELMAMVIGNEVYDWEEFERLTKYRGVFTKDHKTIRFFWDVFHEFTLEGKNKFLEFLSGSDRIPMQGMSHLKPMIIQPMDTVSITNYTNCNTDFIPAALTCHSVLLLPLYESKEQLKKKLTMTLENAQGFEKIDYSVY